MISKSQFGAIAFIAAIVMTSSVMTTSVFAATPYPNYGRGFYSPSGSGGGSAGYNERIETYRAHHHHNNMHTGSQTK
jgi:hypothetical protein